MAFSGATARPEVCPLQCSATSLLPRDSEPLARLEPPEQVEQPAKVAWLLMDRREAREVPEASVHLAEMEDPEVPRACRDR